MPESGMPATPPPPAAHVPESATTALYRAALGPVNTERCLQVFERFDEAGRASPVWNPAAAFLTLNWMVFRQLWGAALVYGVCVGAVLLLAFGLGRQPLQQWPPGVVWGVLGVLVLLVIAIPGVYGYAMLHADTRRRMTRAVREASTLREACATLSQQASTRRRLGVLVLLNALLVMAVAGVYLAPGWRSPVLKNDANGARIGPVDTAAPGPLAALPAAAPEPVPAPLTAQPSATEPAASVPSSPIDAEPAGPPPAAPSSPEPRVPAAPVARSSEPKKAMSADNTPQAHGINVGLFADRANAEKAQARLAEAGFAAILQTVERPNGALTRVRVGPFASRSQADEAAARIRALGLDAVVFRP